jgi:hypothetical protein
MHAIIEWAFRYRAIVLMGVVLSVALGSIHYSSFNRCGSRHHAKSSPGADPCAELSQWKWSSS